MNVKLQAKLGPCVLALACLVVLGLISGAHAASTSVRGRQNQDDTDEGYLEAAPSSAASSEQADEDYDEEDESPRAAASNDFAQDYVNQGSPANTRSRAQFLANRDEPSELDGDAYHVLGTNIENAKLEVSPHEMQTAAGHHHHHKHYPHGKMEMGAHTGKKGAFGWHSKHPVGGKGR